MRFDIRHETVYRYSGPVFLDPHLIRLRPRSDWSQQLLDFHVEIDPEPEGCAQLVDLDGNDTIRPWFSGTHQHLRIVVTSTVETSITDPFGFFVEPGSDELPVVYGRQTEQLAPYLRDDGIDSAVTSLGQQVRDEGGDRTVSFLTSLNRKVRELCVTETRLEGDPLAPSETLARGKGACRDVTVLFMAVCRSVGLAARFTSGYVAGSLQEERYLHAWAEVYVPGAGWRGFDPSLGLVVADRHVALASGPTPAAARPFEGRFRGTDVTAEMEVTLRIESE